MIIIGIVLVGVFVIGLAWSISTGLAGFWRGLPFWVIVVFCLFLLITDVCTIYDPPLRGVYYKHSFLWLLSFLMLSDVFVFLAR